MHDICLLIIVALTRCAISVHIDVSEQRTQPAQDDVRSRLPNRFVNSLERYNLTRPLTNNQRHISSSTKTEPAKQTNMIEHEMDVRTFPNRPILRRVLNPRPVSEHRTQPAQDDVRSGLPHRFVKSLDLKNITRTLFNNQRHISFTTHTNSAKQTNMIENTVDFRTSQNRPILRRVLNPRTGRYKDIPIASSKLTSSGNSNMNHVNFDDGYNKNQMPVRPLSNRRYKERRLSSRVNLDQFSQQRTSRQNRNLYQGGYRERTNELRRYQQIDLRRDQEQRMYLDLQREDRQTNNNRWRQRHVTTNSPSSIIRNRHPIPNTRHQQPNRSTQLTRYGDRENVNYFVEERQMYNDQPIQSSRRHFERHIRHFS